MAIVVTVVAVAAVTATAWWVRSREQTYPVIGRIVVLDPGHFESQDDTGARITIDGVTLFERDVNWEVTLQTATMLESHGIVVVLTREPGEFLDRPARYRVAEGSGGEALISVHHNADDDPAINYTTTFYTHGADLEIARRAQDSLVRHLDFPDGDVRVESFGMTVYPSMPAALTEAWFLTHARTASRYLADLRARDSDAPGQGWQAGSLVQLEAQALTEAIVEFLESHPPPR